MKRERGFTLIELMIVVAIIALIAGFALFNYGKYGYRARRVDGKDMLARVAAAQERYYTNFNSYATSLTALNFTNAPPCNLLGASEKCYYQVTTANGTSGDTGTYQLTATPQGAQANDACKNLILRSDNKKLFSGSETNGSCW